MSKSYQRMYGLLKSKAIYYWKPFNRKRLSNFYKSFIQSGDLCFDVGAHIGNRMDAWLNLGAQVIAIEPQPACVNYLEKRFGNHPNAKILHQALGEHPGKLPLKISNQHPTVSTFADSSWQEKVNAINDKIIWDEEIEVEMLTLDLLIEQYGIPAFCKIDVEGFEASVLAGLSQALPILSFEFFSFTPKITQDCLNQMERLGNYEYNWSPGESQRMAMEEWGEAKKLLSNIQAYKRSNFTGDIYARLINK
jgi:methyltransferase, FkbM family